MTYWNSDPKPERREPKPRKPLNKKRKATGQLAVFLRIWNKRSHICQVTGEKIHEFNVGCFSHLAPKSSYPEGLLDEENIWLVLEEIHQEWENTDKSDPKFKKKLEEREYMKNRYREQRIKNSKS